MLRFRNIDADPADPVETWPTEGIIAALERGDAHDWSRIYEAVNRDPWGPVSRRLEDALRTTRPYGIAMLMDRVLIDARTAAEAAEREEVARRVTELLETSGLNRTEFAAAVGTSASRLSTYLTGKVAPSSTMIVRMERIAGDAAGQARSRPAPGNA